MGKKKKGAAESSSIKAGGAPAHGVLKNDLVHLFVDDQNLFWGIVNDEKGRGFRLDFGQLAITAALRPDGSGRGIRTSYIAGVIPDNDSFWKVAQDQGFTVRRGYLGSNRRSKQDDAYLITDITSTLFEQEGPSTIVLVAGDADYVPPLKKAIERGWRVEVAFTTRGISASLTPWVHQFRTIKAVDIEHSPSWRR
jgi:hypothetical protein